MPDVQRAFGDAVGMAAVCCYFNPTASRNRLANYHRFIRSFARHGLRLFTVEMACGARGFELPDSPDLFRVRSPDVLWQKERLLQLAVDRAAAEGYRSLAWVDTDVEFHNPDWVRDAVDLLRSVPLCQLFRSVQIELSPGGPVQSQLGAVAEWQVRQVIKPTGPATGYAWAARMDLLRDVRFYDRFVVGGGDKAFWAACLCHGDLDAWRAQMQAVSFWRLGSAALRDHYFNWARVLGDRVRSQVGCLPDTIKTWYHGSRSNRQYIDRQRLLADFDPELDLRVNPEGLLEWARSRPALAGKIVEYFISRKEDIVDAPAT
jgi:hypothetical protein